MAINKDDQKLCIKVTNKLTTRGIRAPCKVNVTVRNGEVTLSGEVVQAHQKSAAASAAHSVEGVRRVYDQLIVKAVDKRSASAQDKWTIKPLKSEQIEPIPTED